MKRLITLTALVCSLSTLANDVFIIKKNIKAKNVLHLKATVESCKFSDPYITPYWIMGESDNHTEGLTFLEKPFFSPYFEETSESEIKFSLGAINRMDLGESSSVITVRLENCTAKAYATLEGQEVELKEVSANGRFALTGWKTNFVELRGKNQDGSEYYIKLEP